MKLPELINCEGRLELNQALRAEDAIIDEECMQCQRRDTCKMLESRIAFYPEMDPDELEYPVFPGKWSRPT